MVLTKAAELHKAGKLEEARKLYEAVLGKTIKDSYVLFQLATIYLQMGMNGTAMNLYMRSIDEMPENAEWAGETWMNLGVAYKHETHEAESKMCYEEALKYIKSVNDQTLLLANLSGLHCNAGKPREAIAYARRALELDPFHPESGFHMALAMLEDHQYEEGWRWYNCRLRQQNFHVRPFQCDMWDGGPTELLAIHAEQGIGDEIMFASLIPRATAIAKRVVVECTGRLIQPFERSFGVKCYPNHEAMLAAEKPTAWVAMGSLPDIFKIYQPITHSGYLTPDAERVEHWKREYPGFRVGISWRGGTRKTHEHLRNFQVEEWMPLFADKSIRFLSLQYGDWGDELSRLGLIDVKPESFDDHIALTAACDLVISVCNTTVHEAGATNTPCWCLVPNKPAWRYGTRGEVMLWYPGVKLYRQKEKWADVIEAIAADLGRLRGGESPDAHREGALRNLGPALRAACA